MQNNYFVFIKLRVGEYVENIWECEVFGTKQGEMGFIDQKCTFDVLS